MNQSRIFSSFRLHRGGLSDNNVVRMLLLIRHPPVQLGLVLRLAEELGHHLLRGLLVLRVIYLVPEVNDGCIGGRAQHARESYMLLVIQVVLQVFVVGVVRSNGLEKLFPDVVELPLAWRGASTQDQIRRVAKLAGQNLRKGPLDDALYIAVVIDEDAIAYQARVAQRKSPVLPPEGLVLVTDVAIHSVQCHNLTRNFILNFVAAAGNSQVSGAPRGLEMMLDRIPGRGEGGPASNNTISNGEDLVRTAEGRANLFLCVVRFIWIHRARLGKCQLLQLRKHVPELREASQALLSGHEEQMIICERLATEPVADDP